MRATSVEQAWTEPTVLSAVRQFWVMVLVAALLAAAGGVGYSLLVPKRYRADATITVPPTSQAQGDNSDQYLDSQVLLLRSAEVTDRAVRIANTALNRNVLTAEDFLPDAKLLKIVPPEGRQPGTYGSSLISISFTWTDPQVAQVGANAVLQAFDDARVAAIDAEGEAAVAAIEKAIRDARTRGQLSDLVNKRTETLVNQQVDAARHPTFTWAVLPKAPVNVNSQRSAATGLVMGAVLGSALAYGYARRRGSIRDASTAAAVYDAPLIGEVPAPSTSAGRALPVGALPLVAEPESPGAEAYRLAAGYLERIRDTSEGPLVVALVGAAADGTKSVVLANLALAAAERGTSVLAVDADSSSGRLTSLLLPGNSRGEGFEEVLGGQRSLSECLQPSELDLRLTVLGASASAVGPRSRGLPYAKAVEELIGKAKTSFDLILMDSPPLLTKAEASELAAQAGTAIVLVDPDDGVREHLTMVERLDLVGAQVVGYLFRTVQTRPWSTWRLQDRRAAARARRSLTNSTVPTWE